MSEPAEQPASSKRVEQVFIGWKEGKTQVFVGWLVTDERTSEEAGRNTEDANRVAACDFPEDTGLPSWIASMEPKEACGRKERWT